MSRLFAIFALMFAYTLPASAATALDTVGTFKSCQIMADDTSSEKKEGEEEEAEPECD